MALEGKLTWKGIDIDSAYVVISNAQCNVNYDSNMVLKTEATYNEDGSIKTEALYEKEWTKSIYGHYNGLVFKDKASKDAEPASPITSISGNYSPNHAASAKNDVRQAYEALKLVDAYKDLADA